LIYWLCVVVASVLSIHERRSRNPCAVLADTRRLSTSALARVGGLCACTSYSVFKEPTAQARIKPRLAGSQFATVGRFWGNLLTLLQPAIGCQTLADQRPGATHRSRRGDVAGARRRLTPTQMSKNLPSCVLLGSPGTRELGD